MRNKKKSPETEAKNKEEENADKLNESVSKQLPKDEKEPESKRKNLGELEVSVIDDEPKDSGFENKYDDFELKNKVEAVLFSSGRALNIDMIQQLIGVYDKKAIKKAIEELKQEYEKKKTSLMLIDEIIDSKESYKLTVRENYMPFVSKIVADTELSKTMIETLAIIAWKAPVKQSEVITIRTNKAYDHIDELERLGFITKEKSGRTFSIKLSQKFYDYFDLRNKKQLEENFNSIKEKVEEKEKINFEKKEMEREQHEKEQRDKLGNLDVYLQEMNQKVAEKIAESETSLIVEEKKDVAVLEEQKKDLTEAKEEKEELSKEIEQEQEKEETLNEETEEKAEEKEEEEISENEQNAPEQKKEVADDFIEGPLEEVAKRRGRKKKEAE